MDDNIDNIIEEQEEKTEKIRNEINEKEEKLKFLKREEIKTMADDIVRVREKETEEEREKISQLKTAEELKSVKKGIERMGAEKEERKKIEEEIKKKIESLKMSSSQPQAAGDSGRETQLKTDEEKKLILEELEKKRREKIAEEKAKEQKEQERAAEIKAEEEIKRKKIEEERKKQILGALEEKKLQRMVEEMKLKAAEREKIFQIKDEEAEKQRKKEGEQKKEALEQMRKVEAKRIKAEEEKEEEEEEKRKLEEGELEKMAAELRARARKRKTPRPVMALPLEKILLVPKPPSGFEKIFIRAIIILFLFSFLSFLGTFWYWYFFKKEGAEFKLPLIGKPAETIPSQQPPEQTPEQRPTETNEKPVLIISPPLIPVESTINLEISAADEVPNKLSHILEQRFPENQFTRVLIINTADNKILETQDFFEAFGIKTPETFFEKTNNDFTLFIYSQKQGNRLGIIAETANQAEISGLLKSWEPNLEEDTKNLFSLIGKKDSSFVHYFRNGKEQGISFRYQTLSLQDLGICYSLTKDYFILTSSWEAMKKVLNKLKNEETTGFFSPLDGAEFILGQLTLKQKIGQLFLIGFEGENLTSETEEIIKTLNPGGVLLLSKNISGSEQLKKLVAELDIFSRKFTNLPLLIAVDQEGGEVSRVKWLQEKTPSYQLKNEKEAYDSGYKRGKELIGLGINLNLAPVLDYALPGDFLFGRSFQKTADISGNLAEAFISGQKFAGIFTGLKHFPGYVGISFNPEEKLATVNDIPEISQFKEAVKSEPELIMTANVIYTEIDSRLPFGFSTESIDFLTKNLEGDYLIISDDLCQNSLLDKFPLNEIIGSPIQANVNILIFSCGESSQAQKAFQLLYKMVENKEISEEKINKSVLKIIQLKKRL